MPNAYIFRRKLGCPLPNFEGTTGHVGWAFELTQGAGICCGATENPKAHPWAPVGGDNGAWQKVVADIAELETVMRKLHYDDYKIVPVTVCDIEQALTVVANNARVGYSAFGNNCLDHTYQVLLHYCALTLPIPTFYPLPNAWFSAANGEHHPL